MNANRRLQERKQPERMVFCKLGGEEIGSVLNLSEDGLCIESLTPIEEKDLLQLRLSVDPNSTVEATGKLAWIDSTKRKVGLHFLELGAPAREQIRAWLSETSTASIVRNQSASLQKRDKQADDGAATENPVSWRVVHIPGTQLVPIERHRAKVRWHFLGGVLLGFGIGAVAVAMIPTLWYIGGTKLGGLAWTTAGANRAAQTSVEQTQASVAQPVPPNASVSSELSATKPLARELRVEGTDAVAPPERSERSERSPRRQSPRTERASSKDLMRISSLWATPQPTKVDQPPEESQSAGAPAPAASKAHSSSVQAQQPKKTPQQLWSALQAGNTKAAVALAGLYTRGEGVPVNCQQARILLLVASEKKNAEASRKLQELDEGGCPANSPANTIDPNP